MKKYALIADDDKVARLIHGRVLINLGYTLIEAENGKEAIDQFLAHQEQLDLILMDYHMPEINGISAVQEIRQIESTLTDLRIPIVGITAEISATIKKACMDAGMNIVINKPISISELENILRKAALEKKS